MSRGYVIRLEGTALPSDGDEQRYAGSYLKRFDFVDCAPGECNMDTVADPEEAKLFDTMQAAMAFYMQVDPRAPKRLDGRPNRPLTIFTVGILPIDRVLA